MRDVLPDSTHEHRIRPGGLGDRRGIAPGFALIEHGHAGRPGQQLARRVSGEVALEVADALGVPPPEQPVEVTFSRWRSQESVLPGGGLLVNDAWNANPVAMRAALASLVERAAGRRTVAILGDMAELGSEAPHFHEEIGREAAAVDLVVGVGELARGYAPDEWAPTAAEAIGLAQELLQPGDVVLVKGSRSVGLEAVAAALLEAFE